MTTREPGTALDRTPGGTATVQPPALPASDRTHRVTAVRDGWPVEHPLDYDWRFTPDSIHSLGGRFAAGGPVALLGAPSLVHEAAERGWQSDVVLYDRNPAIVRAVRAAFPAFETVCVDLVWGDPVGVGDAATVVADPPWYPEHTTAFLWAAARRARLGGRVFLSLPPVETRPGILAEREGVFADAAAFGLRLEAVEAGALSYRTPPFERNALSAGGAIHVPDDWRRGDLAVFAMGERTPATRPSPSSGPDGWDEETVGAVRIKCREVGAQQFGDPTIAPLTPSGILTTVSRRHPTRMAADVWTSGNRIYRCAAPGILRLVVAAVGRRSDPEAAVAAAVGRKLTPAEAAQVRRATAQVIDLARREERELLGHDPQPYERGVAGGV